MLDAKAQVAGDVYAVGRIDAVPTLLRVVCEITGMRFAAVARVTEDSWTACAVLDQIDFGLQPGGQLDVETTLCKEVREARTPIVIDAASAHETYCAHPTPKIYGFESYLSVPILLPDGAYFGNLCALDPRPANVSEPRVVGMFTLFAQLIGEQLENNRCSERQSSALLDAATTADVREQFIAVLGHDLRNPLGVIESGTAILNATSKDANVLAIAGRIGRSVRRMSDLINDLLDFARGRLGGGFHVRMDQSFAVEQVLQEIADEAQANAPERCIQVSIQAPPMINGDRVRIQQLASNLLGNAIQHGAAESPVQFSAKVSQGSLVITVSNQGPPIPPESLEKVFQPFWRRSTSEHREGLGLGLFICSEIVRAHGGQIEVMSSVEHGTTFAVRLPMPSGEGAAPAA